MSKRQMEFGLLDCRDDDDHYDLGFVGISKLFVIQGTFFFCTEPFDWVYVSQSAELYAKYDSLIGLEMDNGMIFVGSMKSCVWKIVHCHAWQVQK